jgi:hypothetical protein
MLVCPCVIEKSDILFSTKNITSGNGQSGYGKLLWTWPSWWPASSKTREPAEGARPLWAAFGSLAGEHPSTFKYADGHVAKEFARPSRLKVKTQEMADSQW